MVSQILVIEDDKDIGQYLRDFLLENNYRVHVEDKGTAGIEYFRKHEPDLLLLDLNLPDMDGESVCAQIKKDYPEIPVIILTARNSMEDKIKELNLGADDYIAKPFDSGELLARIRARLRSKSPAQAKLAVSDLELDPKSFKVTRAGKAIKLTPQEFKLLEYLMSNPGMVLTRDMILNRIWEYSPDVESRVVDVYFGYLRRKIDKGFKQKLLHSVRGFGYSVHE